MATNSIDVGQIDEAIDSLRREVKSLGERIAALEGAVPENTHKSAPRREETTKTDGISEELALVISAAIAAYLGVKPRIGQIRLLQSYPWSQQGRVTIQASHAIPIHHG